MLPRLCSPIVYWTFAGYLASSKSSTSMPRCCCTKFCLSSSCGSGLSARFGSTCLFCWLPCFACRSYCAWLLADESNFCSSPEILNSEWLRCASCSNLLAPPEMNSVPPSSPPGILPAALWSLSDGTPHPIWFWQVSSILRSICLSKADCSWGKGW